MYTTTRKVKGSTVMTCKDCGHTISMNQICDKPIRAAIDMLKHLSAHNTARAFAAAERVIGPQSVLAVASETPLSVSPTESL